MRLQGLRADLDHAARSLKAQFKYADKALAPKVVVLGGDELDRGVARLRDMQNSTEIEVPLGELIQTLKNS